MAPLLLSRGSSSLSPGAGARRPARSRALLSDLPARTRRRGALPRSERWSQDDTALFYRGLAAFGTDFTLIAQLFPSRDRRNIKNKFTREEREFPDEVRVLRQDHAVCLRSLRRERCARVHAVLPTQIREALHPKSANAEDKRQLLEQIKQRLLAESQSKLGSPEPASLGSPSAALQQPRAEEEGAAAAAAAGPQQPAQPAAGSRVRPNIMPRRRPAAGAGAVAAAAQQQQEQQPAPQEPQEAPYQPAGFEEDEDVYMY